MIATAFSDTIEVLRHYGPIYGPLLLALAFFIYRDWKREQQQSKQINRLVQENREVLIPLVKTCTEVISKNSVIMERNTQVMAENTLAMRHLMRQA